MDDVALTAHLSHGGSGSLQSAGADCARLSAYNGEHPLVGAG
jgi:hypothetical protein